MLASVVHGDAVNCKITQTLTRHTYLNTKPQSSVFSAYLICRILFCAWAHNIKSEMSLDTGPGFINFGTGAESENVTTATSAFQKGPQFEIA